VASTRIKKKGERRITLNLLIVKEPEEILKLLQIGTNIPIWPEFEKYILFDLKHFSARSLLLTENRYPVAHVLVFHGDNKILYFGFFGASNDNQKWIEFLIDSLVEYAKDNGFESLKGPVNVPTIIYGWGFMEKGSVSSLFVHKPVNMPLYPDIFRAQGFTEVLKEYSFEGTFDPSTSDYTEGFTYEDYELLVFDTWEEMIPHKLEFLKLNVRNLPPKSVVTPSSAGVFDSYLEFIKQYGDPSMMVFTRYKKTKKIIGCLVATPNPFNANSFTLLTVVVDKKHRNKGVSWLMFKELFTTSLKRGINYCTTFVGSHVDSTIKMSERLKLPLKRTHTIFSYSIHNNQS
jgi:hypothetical protein